MAKINNIDLPLFIRTATRAELIKMMDIFTVAINDLDSRIGLKEGDTSEIHQTLTALTTTLGSLDLLVGVMTANVSDNVASIQALQSVNRQIYKLSDAQLEDLKAISLNALSTLYSRMGDIKDLGGNVIGGDDELSTDYGSPIGIIQYVIEKASILASTRAKSIANETALEDKAPAVHNHDLDYKPVEWVPSWDDVTTKPTFDWAKVYSDSGNAKIPSSYIPDKPATQTFEVVTTVDMLALTGVNQGDYCVVTVGDPDVTYVALIDNPDVIGDWQEFNPGVASVDGAQGVVVLSGVYAPISGSANYRSNTWVPSWGDVTGKPAMDWAKVFADSGDAKIPQSYLPAIALTDTHTVATEVAQLALDVQKGDVCVRTDLHKSYIFIAVSNDSMSDWQELHTPTDAVSSVDGETGTVVLNAVRDGDFTSEGILIRGAASGSYDVITNNSQNWDAAVGWGDHGEIDYVKDSDFGANGILVRTATGVYGVVTDNTVAWDLAYSHALADHAPSTADVTADNETSHDDVLVDGQFTVAGYMVTDGHGVYSVSEETFLSTILEEELAGYLIGSTQQNVEDTDNILEALGKLEFRVNVNDAKVVLTNDQVIASNLTDFTPATVKSTIVAGDTLLSALEKLEFRVALNDDKVTNDDTPEGSGGLVPSNGNAGEFLKHDGTFGVPAYIPDTNLSNAEVIGMELTGFTPTIGNVVAGKTILEAIEHLEYRVNLNDAKPNALNGVAVADQNDASAVMFWTGTQLEYDNIGAGNYDADILYFIVE